MTDIADTIRPKRSGEPVNPCVHKHYSLPKPWWMLLPVIALSACTTPRVISQPCLTKEQVEELRRAEPEKVAPKLTGRADEDLRIVSGSALRLRAWGLGLLGTLEGCSS